MTGAYVRQVDGEIFFLLSGYCRLLVARVVRIVWALRSGTSGTRTSKAGSRQWG